MDNNQLKTMVARHFDYANPGTGQFLHGDWFTPKHKDSLGDILDEIVGNEEKLQEEIESLLEKVEDLEGELQEKDKEAVPA
jgi:peptidoglycan hydrolase CwlO-like protein